MNRLHALFAVTLLATAACGDDEETATTLDCAWLADENNCWRQVARAAEACATTGTGTLDDAATSCTFDDGFHVAFDEPIVLPFPDDEVPAWNFVATRDGATCLEVHESGRASKVTTSAGTVKLGGSQTTLEVTCADGSIVRGDALQLLGCEDAGLFDAPATGASWTDDAFTFVLNGVTPADAEAGSFFSTLPIFSCMTAGETPQNPPFAD